MINVSAYSKKKKVYYRWTNREFQQRYGNYGENKQMEILDLKNIIWNKKVIGGINRTWRIKGGLGNMT